MKNTLSITVAFFLCAPAFGQHTYMRDAANDRNKKNAAHETAPIYQRKGGNVNDEQKESIPSSSEDTHSASVFEPKAGDADGPFPYQNEEGKFGFKDENGEIVIPCTYDEVSRFTNGFAVVSLGGFYDSKKGVIDGSGRLIVPIKYGNINMNEDLFYVYMYAGGKTSVGVMDTEGQTVVPVIYQGVFNKKVEDYFIVLLHDKSYNYFPATKSLVPVE